MREEIYKTVLSLEDSGTILYPTDTIWGVGCDATNEQAVEKIYQLKQRESSKSMIVLVESEARLQSIVEVPEIAWDLIDVHSDSPLTIIYDNPDPKKIAKNLIAEDNTVAIRLVKEEFLVRLIGRLKKPLVSTSANISGEASPKQFSDVSKDICNGVDYVVNLQQSKVSDKSSTIIKLSANGQVKVIRK